MPARTPRRSFATPFVVTLAAAPACYVQSSSPPPQQPTPVVAQQPPSEPRPSPVMNPPRPQPETHVPAGTKWTLYKQADGTCMAGIQVQCQPKATCNPPPPFEVACPTDVELSKPVVVVASDDGTCHVEQPPPNCRPGISCNPPRPQPVACPTRQ